MNQHSPNTKISSTRNAKNEFTQETAERRKLILTNSQTIPDRKTAAEKSLETATTDPRNDRTSSSMMVSRCGLQPPHRWQQPPSAPVAYLGDDADTVRRHLPVNGRAPSSLVTPSRRPWRRRSPQELDGGIVSPRKFSARKNTPSTKRVARNTPNTIVKRSNSNIEQSFLIQSDGPTASPSSPGG